MDIVTQILDSTGDKELNEGELKGLCADIETRIHALKVRDRICLLLASQEDLSANCLLICCSTTEGSLHIGDQ
jgi:hypothetical protein